MKYSESGCSAAFRVPDELTELHLREVKNRSYVGYNSQMKDYFLHSQDNNLKFILDVRKGSATNLSKTLLKMEETGLIIVNRYL